MPPQCDHRTPRLLSNELEVCQMREQAVQPRAQSNSQLARGEVVAYGTASFSTISRIRVERRNRLIPYDHLHSAAGLVAACIVFVRCSFLANALQRGRQVPPSSFFNQSSLPQCIVSSTNHLYFRPTFHSPTHVPSSTQHYYDGIEH